jgi:pilus assembly protein CpaE
VSVMTPPETNQTFRPQGAEAGVHLYLSGVQGDEAALLGARVAGLPLQLSIVPVTEWIDPNDLGGAAVAVVQVDADAPASIKRFERLAKTDEKPLIAACYDPPLALVRQLLKAGAHDVLPLPLSLDDLETSVAPLREQVAKAVTTEAVVNNNRLVVFLKARGGSGATAIATQLACRFAAAERQAGREAALLDLDLQFGDAAFQLGLRPRLTLTDLIEAGPRLDGPLLRSAMTQHDSGLFVAAAPSTMLPLESLSNEQAIAIVERGMREFGTLFVDLPANWANWSLSVVARAKVVLLVTDLSIAGLHHARRQIDLLDTQGLEDIDLRVVANRFRKSLFKSVSLDDAEQALGRKIAFTVADEPDILGAAIDQGVTVGDIRRKSPLVRDLDAIDGAITNLLRLER